MTGGWLWKINENKRVTFENLVIQDLEIQSNDNSKNAGSVIFNNVRDARRRWYAPTGSSGVK